MKRMKLFAAVLLLATIVAGNDTWAVSALGKKDTRPAESPKFFSGNANPLSDFIFVADPTSVEYNGRLYVYGTNDTQQLDSVGKDGKNTYQYIHSLVMLSTDDMVNWTYHGLIDVKALSPWGIASWAPSIVSRVEADGKTHFYLYYSNSGAGVGVLTSTSPVGPWTDPLGRMLVSQFTQGLGNCKAPFDPGAVIYVVNLLKRRNLDLPVAVLPTGTANDFANTLGVPSDIEKACRRILGGEIRRVDLGRANDEYFVNVFSCGLFTDVSQKTPTILKNTFGKLAYYFGGLGELPNFRKMHISIESDGGNYEGPSLIFFVFNGRTAGQMRFAYLSEIDDGLLDVIVIKGDRPIETVRTIFHFIKRNTKDYPAGIVHFKSRDILLHSYNEETTDIDGQPGPRFPVRIACEPGALRVICPQKKPKK